MVSINEIIETANAYVWHLGLQFCWWRCWSRDGTMWTEI